MSGKRYVAMGVGAALAVANAAKNGWKAPWPSVGESDGDPVSVGLGSSVGGFESSAAGLLEPDAAGVAPASSVVTGVAELSEAAGVESDAELESVTEAVGSSRGDASLR
jgi:hypothetical protein